MVIGYLHRSMEKLAEERTYTQNIPFTDRMDYLAAMTGQPRATASRSRSWRASRCRSAASTCA